MNTTYHRSEEKKTSTTHSTYAAGEERLSRGASGSPDECPPVPEPAPANPDPSSISPDAWRRFGSATLSVVHKI
jgi:hypothetical protein